MRPWCEVEGCGREAVHSHPAPPAPREVRDRGTSAGTSAPPEALARGGASPEVEAGDRGEGSTDWAAVWASVEAGIADAEARLAGARDRRRRLLGEMRAAGLSFGEIAGVTGLSRQRVQVLLAG